MPISNAAVKSVKKIKCKCCRSSKLFFRVTYRARQGSEDWFEITLKGSSLLIDELDQVTQHVSKGMSLKDALDATVKAVGPVTVTGFLAFCKGKCEDETSAEVVFKDGSSVGSEMGVFKTIAADCIQPGVVDVVGEEPQEEDSANMESLEKVMSAIGVSISVTGSGGCGGNCKCGQKQAQQPPVRPADPDQLLDQAVLALRQRWSSAKHEQSFDSFFAAECDRALWRFKDV